MKAKARELPWKLKNRDGKCGKKEIRALCFESSVWESTICSYLGTIFSLHVDSALVLKIVIEN